MKYRVNYLTVTKDGTQRSIGHIIDAKTPEEATQKTIEILERQLGNDNYRITTVKPW